jgi:hypothetical protein
MGAPLIIKYTYLSECSFETENLEKIKSKMRDLVNSLFSLCGDESTDYTKIKTLDSPICRGYLIMKSGRHSTITIELNDVINVVFITLQSSKQVASDVIDRLIINFFTPKHFNSRFTERYLP